MYVCVCVCVCVYRLLNCVQLCNSMDCSLPGSSGVGKNTGVGCHFLLQGIFPAWGSNLHLCVPCICRWVLYCHATWESHMYTCSKWKGFMILRHEDDYNFRYLKSPIGKGKNFKFTLGENLPCDFLIKFWAIAQCLSHVLSRIYKCQISAPKCVKSIHWNFNRVPSVLQPLF